ncbi:unnamed protein product [Caenorhabditis auriculariae]|uniref:U4/U6.U5 tri-snRNP-associated protein 1 n=1 Tax=Caenorhabditis auriculariae TaxID=2777116 RepID=A0A8S1HBF9_9PELO|nr:unnamed protein product [Caenorhabditis auriculariae]
MSSKYARKRKGFDEDTSEEGQRMRERGASRKDRSSSRSVSPPKSKKTNREAEEDRSEPADSMSIEETNKLRASLGLAPLEVDDTPKVRDAEDGTNEQIINEDGFEFRHRKAENLAEKKREQSVKEKLEVSKAKREIYAKVLKEKKLADDSDDEGSASNWVERMRRKEEEEKRKAEERAKTLDAMDEEIEGHAVAEENKNKKAKKPRGPNATAGLIVGHSREAFVEGAEHQILVLEDKGVLDEGDEVLVNPNLIDNERTARNVELRKRKDPYRNFDEDVDKDGNLKSFGVLAKYDEELEGVQREKFRLDDRGGVDMEREQRELAMRKQLEMAGKKLVSLDTPKYQLASEFYTAEEMIAFRKPKKGNKEKMRKRTKILKASDLVPDEPAGERNLGRRRQRDADEDEEMPENGKNKVKSEDEEDGEIKKEPQNDGEDEPQNKSWKKAMHGNGVDLERLRKFKERAARESDEDSDDEMHGGVDLTGVVIDDDAQNELYSVLERTRKVKRLVSASNGDDDVGKKVQEMLNSHGVKMEVDDEDEVEAPLKDGALYIDSTMEYCRNIGEIPTYGLAGNRDDSIDVSEMRKVEDVKQVKEEVEDESEGFKRWKRAQVDRELRKKQKRAEEDRGGWLAAGEPMPGSSSARLDSEDEEELEKAKNMEWSDDDDEEGAPEYENVLGKEADVSKGVGAMLKLAAQKGYLTDPNAKKYTGPNLDHLKNRSKSQIDAGKYDIEDKYMKKLDRLGTTGRGPIQAFPEKKDYNPEITICYVDKKGRDMDAKDAYRELSYKFHGRNPGKKQLEKRSHKREKQERLLHTNSYDTPLGTLSKQLKKQKQLQTPYLVLSGSTDHSSLKKE